MGVQFNTRGGHRHILIRSDNMFVMVPCGEGTGKEDFKDKVDEPIFNGENYLIYVLGLEFKCRWRFLKKIPCFQVWLGILLW